MTIATTLSSSTRRRVLAVTCLALAAVVSAVASLNVALPSMARDTHASQTQLSWIIDAYALVFAALLLPGGALGDRYGRRRVLVVGLAVFGLGSAASMAVSEPVALIGLRGVLGLGAALVMPATLSTITATFGPDDRARAVGVWAGVAGGSAILGLLCSGLLLEAWSWRAVFGLNVVLAGLALVATLRVVPESSDPHAPRLDLVGALLVVLGLGAIVYSVIEAPEVGWLTARTLIGLAVGLLVLVVFVGVASGRVAPLLDPRLFGNPRFAAASLSITVQFFAFFGFVFVALQYLQLARADSPLIAALSVVPMALAMMPCARLAPRLATHVGVRRVCVTGLVLVAAGLFAVSRIDHGTSYWFILCALLPLGAGMGLAMTPATAALTDALPESQQGVASAVNDLARELGGALGIAVLGTLLNGTYRDHIGPHLSGLAQPVAERARSSFALASRLGEPVAGSARSAFIDGMHVALMCASGAVLLTALAVALLLRPRPGAEPDGRQA